MLIARLVRSNSLSRWKFVHHTPWRPLSTQNQSAGSVDADELTKFAKLSQEWWLPTGEFALLHKLNPIRIEFLLSQTANLFPSSSRSKPLAGLSALDIGCGGGILSEALARLGAQVQGIDMVELNIAVAQTHANNDPSVALGDRLHYRCTTAEMLVKEGRRFDIVVASEVVEHVANRKSFVADCVRLVNPRGALVFSTINRTFVARALAVFVAENVLRWVPQGTHDPNKFVTPEELQQDILQASSGLNFDGSVQLSHVQGLALCPVTQAWSFSTNTSMNYILAAVFDQKPLSK